MNFKEMVSQDRSAVFIDLDFFAEEYRIEGKKIPIVMDIDELKRRQGSQDLAVAESATLFYARVEDLPPRRTAGQNLNVNGRECIIDEWKVDMGIATIVLRENVIA
ncbi:MAG: sugar ABC transporter ATP-binding protein [Oscillospiraceae bacterium]|nr:sugar ABC transporter ATP-binding protein [Oscillospiraceae bacterium]